MRGKLFCATAVLVAGILISACGAKTHPNDPRPPVPTVVNVAVTAHGIQVTPKAVGVPGVVPVRVNQNLRAPVNQADRKAPAVVQVTIANLTSRNTKLFLEGPKSASEVIPAQGSGSFNRALPNGIYRFSSPASTGTARFAVGPSRVSSSGDVLTP